MTRFELHRTFWIGAGIVLIVIGALISAGVTKAQGGGTQVQLALAGHPNSDWPSNVSVNLDPGLYKICIQNTQSPDPDSLISISSPIGLSGSGACGEFRHIGGSVSFTHAGPSGPVDGHWGSMVVWAELIEEPATPEPPPSETPKNPLPPSLEAIYCSYFGPVPNGLQVAWDGGLMEISERSVVFTSWSGFGSNIQVGDVTFEVSGSAPNYSCSLPPAPVVVETAAPAVVFECELNTELVLSVEETNNRQFVTVYEAEQELVKIVEPTIYLEEEIFESPLEINSAVFSPDGCKIALSVRERDSDDPFQVFVIPTFGGEWFSQATDYPGLSREVIGWSRDRWEIYTIDFSLSVQTLWGESISAFNQYGGQRRYMPNLAQTAELVGDRLIAFSDPGGLLAISDIFGQNVVETNLAGVPVGSTPNGQSVFFTEGASLFELELDQGTTQLINQNVTGIALDPSGTGRGVVVAGDELQAFQSESELTSLQIRHSLVQPEMRSSQPDWFSPEAMESTTPGIDAIASNFSNAIVLRGGGANLSLVPEEEFFIWTPESGQGWADWLFELGLSASEIYGQDGAASRLTGLFGAPQMGTHYTLLASQMPELLGVG